MNSTKTEHRLQYRFWLDVVRSEEERLAEYVEQLKIHRRFAQTIREALQLIQDLRAGRVTILLLLFPWIEDYFREKFTPQAMPQQDRLAQQLDQLTHLLRQERPQLAVDQPPKQLPAPAAQPLDDLAAKLELTRTTTTDRWSNYKFLYNMLLSQYAADPRHWDHFSADNLEYGLETGKFPAHLIPAAQQALAQRRQRAKQLQGADAPLAPPNLEDLDLL